MSYLHMYRFMGDVWILPISRALVVFGTVRLPIAQAHPAEVVLARVALHVVAATVLLDANVALGTVFGVGAYVVCRLAVVRTFRQPLLDHVAVSRSVVFHAAPEGEYYVALEAL